MKNFDDIKDLWQQQPPSGNKDTEPIAIHKMPAGIKAKLLRQQATAITVLTIIAAILVWVGFFSGGFFKRTITYVGLLMSFLVIMMQWGILLYTYLKIKKIDDTLAPAAHLQQWQAYYLFRKKQVQWNMPLYFVLLNLAMVLYLAETVIDHFSGWVAILLVVYIALMLYTYLVLEKMSMAREEKRIQRIITYLKELSQQLEEE